MKVYVDLLDRLYWRKGTMMKKQRIYVYYILKVSHS